MIGEIIANVASSQQKSNVTLNLKNTPQVNKGHNISAKVTRKKEQKILFYDNHRYHWLINLNWSSHVFIWIYLIVFWIMQALS